MTGQPMAVFWVDAETDGAALKAIKGRELCQALNEVPSSVNDMNS